MTNFVIRLDMGDEREALLTERTRMIEYLRLKVHKGDWHGVADAAMDLREIEAKLELIGKAMQGGAQ